MRVIGSRVVRFVKVDSDILMVGDYTSTRHGVGMRGYGVLVYSVSKLSRGRTLLDKTTEV